MEQSHRFGRVEVRATERVVLVDGCATPLGARALDVLLALIEHRDRLVTKHELLDIVWPGLVVEENNLAVQVSTLRKILGPQTIVTVPGRGYRFAASLDARPDVPASSEVSAAPQNSLPSLPALSTLLLGRDEDLAALHELLQHSRLVTVVGAGGIGKTSLALAAAHARQASYRDGVAWVNLTEIDDAAQVSRAVAQTAGLPAVASGDPLPPLLEALKPLQMLLVFDNAEHVLDGVLRLAEAITTKTPGIRVLVTSQAALKIDGERVFRLGPLSLPVAGASLDQARSHGAVALFAEQANAADRRFALSADNVAAVIDLCRHLDGVALAIKLAAARVPLLGLQGLASRLGDRLRLLGNGSRTAPPHQQTLHAALDWSHGLLDENARRVFRRLAVFADGFTLELAGAVAGAGSLDPWQVIDSLGEMVDRSLVEMDGAARPRYRLLETARAYSRLKLDEAGERELAQERHAEAIASLAEDSYESYWVTPDKPWLEAFEPEIDNVRAALDWSKRHRHDLALRLAASFSPVFLLTGQAPEARRHLADLETAVAEADATPAARRYWLERSRLHWGISSAQMRDFADRAAALYRAAEDPRGLYLALRCAAGSGAASVADASAMLEEMSALEAADWPPRLRSQRMLAEISVLSSTGRLTEARTVCDGVMSLATAAGLDLVASVALVGLAVMHLALDEPDQALRSARTFIAAPGARRGNLVLHAMATVANALLAKSQVSQARDAIAELIAASRCRAWEWFGQFSDVFALLAVAQGRCEAAARLIGYGDEAYRRAGTRGVTATRARSQVFSAIEAVLPSETIARLLADGGRMDEETVCALTLAGVDVAAEPD